jgi:HPt (histidine-containing phosphotransfer) domain-containing protein
MASGERKGGPSLEVTASDLHPELLRCMRRAGVESIKEPPRRENWHLLLHLLSRTYLELDLARARLYSAPAPPPAPEPSAEPNTQTGEHAPPSLDRTVLDSLRSLMAPGAGDPAAELCGVFFDDMALRLRKIQAAIAVGDANEVANQAHAIKGAAGNFGARAAYELAKRLQAAAETGAAPPELADELSAELERVREVVDKEILDQ